MPDPSANFGRADYDATIRTHAIPGDEPKFILRAQDAVVAAGSQDLRVRQFPGHFETLR